MVYRLVVGVSIDKKRITICKKHNYISILQLFGVKSQIQGLKDIPKTWKLQSNLF